jgi:hypothetical protein
MKTIFFIAATVAFNALSVFADGTISVKQTVLQRYFDNDPAKYQKAIRKLFAKFDANEDREINAVDFEHLSSQSNMILKQLMGSSSMGTQSVKDMVMSFDKDGNGNVSQKEFETGMAPYQKQVVTVKMSMIKFLIAHISD